MSPRTQKQAGFAIVTAVFLIVLLAVVGGFIFAISYREGVVPERTLLSSRAHIANRSALEWALHQAIGPLQGSDAPSPAPGNCAPSTTFTLSGYGLDDIAVAVTCSVKDNYGTPSQWVYTYYLTATVAVGTSGTSEYVERKLEGVVCRSKGQTGSAC